MVVGVLQLELSISDAMSLKDKRRVVLSIKDRIAHGHNVSIAEVGALDEHRRAILGIAMVSNDSRYVEGALSKLVDFVRMVPQVSLVDYQIELIPRDQAELLYPAPYADSLIKYAPERSVDPRFALSIMRQESRYRADVKSVAAARGSSKLRPIRLNQSSRSTSRPSGPVIAGRNSFSPTCSPSAR